MHSINLALLASKSAIYLERCSRGTPSPDFDTVNELAEEVYRLSKDENDLYSVMLAYLVWPENEDHRWRNMSKVYVHTNLLAKELAHFRDFSSEKQKELSGVCLHLSRLAQVHDTRNYRLAFVA